MLNEMHICMLSSEEMEMGRVKEAGPKENRTGRFMCKDWMMSGIKVSADYAEQQLQ